MNEYWERYSPCLLCLTEFERWVNVHISVFPALFLCVNRRCASGNTLSLSVAAVNQQTTDCTLVLRGWSRRLLIACYKTYKTLIDCQLVSDRYIVLTQLCCHSLTLALPHTFIYHWEKIKTILHLRGDIGHLVLFWGKSLDLRQQLHHVQIRQFAYF